MGNRTCGRNTLGPASRTNGVSHAPRVFLVTPRLIMALIPLAAFIYSADVLVNISVSKQS